MRSFLSILSLTCLLPVFLAEAKTDFAKEIEPILAEYCYDCHGDGTHKGDFALDEYKSIDAHLKNYDLWHVVWDNLRSHLMPPAEKSQPKPEEAAKVTRWIEEEIFKLDPKNPDPGRVTVRRLNREEYENTIQDIFGLRYNALEQFPPDDTGYGFDTIGDVLSLSPLLMEKYLDAAQHIVNETVHTDGPIIPVISVYGNNFQNEKKQKADYVPFDRPGSYIRKFNQDHPGEYRFEIEYRINGADKETASTANLIFKVNGAAVKKEFLAWGDTQSQKVTVKAPLKKGENELTIELAAVDKAQPGETVLALRAGQIKITGPLDGSYKAFPPEYNKIFLDGAPPAEADKRTAYLRKLVETWGLRLFRRSLEPELVDRFMALAAANQKEGLSFDKSFAQVLTAMLASPRFIFRSEIQPEPNNPGKVVPVDQFALASRLSYFLWSSAPDEKLLQLAKDGKLRENLRPEIDRMIKDSRSRRLVENFTGQWLQTRDLDLVNVNPERILKIDDDEANKIFTYRARQDMRDETWMLFEHILKENRSTLEFLTADYTFLNEPLAKLYGIEGVKGNEMRKVTLGPDSHRGGVLTQGTFLVITSNPTRTSPVKRGLFVLENLLGTPAPPAPEDVPPLEDSSKKGKNKDLTMRQLMEVHRENSLCASCHARMDPIGLTLENYNALGMWRDQENGQPIESAGKLITGEPFTNANELAQILATSRRTDFYRCLTRKLLTYAIGRGVEIYDAPTVDRIVDQLEKDGGKMSTLIYGVVESAPFQKRRGDGNRLVQAAP